DDTFKVDAALPYLNTLVDGGDPSASDVVNFTGSATTANLITVDLGAQTVAEATFGPVSLSGVEVLNVNAASHNLPALGPAGPDNLSYPPTGASAGTVPGVGPTVNFTGVGGTFPIDALGGANALTVIGPAAANTITADGTTVTVGTF